MELTWRARLRAWVCHHFRHRAEYSANSRMWWCTRCGIALGKTPDPRGHNES